MNNLQMLNSWNSGENFMVPRSAQGYLNPGIFSSSTIQARSSACGSSDDNEPKPSACGSACGAGDEETSSPKPSACGSACGAGDN